MENQKILTMEIKANVDCFNGKPSSRYGYVVCSSKKVLHSIGIRSSESIELHCTSCVTCGENQYKAVNCELSEVNYE